MSTSNADVIANAIRRMSEGKTYLNLRWKNIDEDGAKALANALKENTSLQKLELTSNKIGDDGAKALANALKENDSLQELDLQRNKIGDDGATALANALKENASLQELDLEDNEIGDDGATALANALKENASLQELDLRFNQIGDDGATALANALKENASLQMLDLWMNKIGDEGAKALANALKENKSLLKLTLYENDVSRDILHEINALLRDNRTAFYHRLDNDDADAQAGSDAHRSSEGRAATRAQAGSGSGTEERVTIAAQKQNKSDALQELDQSGDGIGPQGAKKMAESLANYPQLHSLNLSKNGIGDRGAEAVACALAEHKSLQNLNLGADQIGHIGAKAVADMLEKNESLLTLNLGWNRIGDGGAAALAKSLAANRTLCSLDLQKNGISAGGVEEIAEALVNSQVLELLNLGWNDIGDDGAVHVAKALEENKSMLFLDIARNKIGNVGAVAVAGALLKNKSLHTLKFRSNSITEDGAEQLANALAKSGSLQALDLAKNRVGMAGARSLAGALTENMTLHFLDLSNNNIGDDGASALAGALAQIKSLVTLHLQNNAIGDVGANEIAKALAANISLQSLNLSENLIGPQGAEDIAGALVKNSTLEELDLADNIIDDEGAKKLAEALEQNKSCLQSLDLSGSRVGSEGAEALALALESNNILQELALGHVSADVFARIGSRLKLVKDELNELSEAAAEALRTDQKVRWGRAKLMVVGKAAAGKTSTIRTLLGQPFVPDHVSTIGIDLMLMHTRDWKERKNIGEADLGEQFAKHKYRNKRKHEEVDLSEAQPSRDAARSVPKAPRAPPPGILASSAPAVRQPPPQSPSVQFDEEVIAKAVNTPLRIRVKEQAGKEEEEVSFTIWDYGGQEVFYALHHLFLTQYGVYVVVFDMREMLGKERFKDKLDQEEFAKLASQDDAIQTLRFWLDSIRLHAPGVEVALVGTFLDQVPELDQHDDIQVILEKKIFRELDGDPKIQRNIWKEEFLQFFPINNQDREDIDGHVARLKDQLTRSVADKPFVKEKVPLRWSYCLDRLLQQSDPYMQFDDVEALAMTKCFVAKEEVRKMLEYLHELGVLLYFSKNEALCKVVVIQPQWLLKNLSRVICDPSAKHMRRHMKKLQSGAGERTASPAHLDSALYQWRDDALASRALLEFLWEGNPVDFLVSLMKSTLLACPSPWVSDDASKKDTILVPSLLRAALEHDKEDGRRWVGDSALAYVDFELLPNGFFQRLVALLLQRFPGVTTVRKKLFADVASVDFNGMKCLMEVSQRRIIFRFSNARQDRPLASLLALLSKELKEINETFMRGKLRPTLYVSSDGTDNDKSCALAESLATPLSGNTIRTRSSCQPFEAFASFVDRTPQAQMLGESAGSVGFQFDAFLGHAWGPANVTHERVKAIERKLAKLGIQCWIDANNIKPEIYRSMAFGIDKSRTTVIFVTREYMEKVNEGRSTNDYCCMEFHYAMDRQKPVRVIACVIDKDMADKDTWDGEFRFRWCGIPLFVPMHSEDEPTDAEIAELAQRIKDTIAQYQLEDK